MDQTLLRAIRYRSRGYRKDPPALIHPNILVGAGEMLTPDFAKKYEITHVINCAQEADSPSWFKEQFPERYHCINAYDSLNVNILDWYPEFKIMMKIFLQSPDSKRIFVHCQCGINRSMFLAVMYCCKEFKFSFEKTEYAMLKQRPCSMTNTVFRQQVFDALK
jgi:hypothetical protein